jgi:hypothetical protein
MLTREQIKDIEAVLIEAVLRGDSKKAWIARDLLDRERREERIALAMKVRVVRAHSWA